MIALDLYVGENALASHLSSPNGSACRRCMQMDFRLIRKPKRKGRMSTYSSVAGLQQHQILGGVVARPLCGERLTVGILDFDPLT